jgi:hypothetical protein
MPIHDWVRVDPNLYHHFHQAWVAALVDTLNSGRLPNGYSAIIERDLGSPTMQSVPVEQRLARLANHVTIRRRLGEVVCVIEVVSPGNKHSKFAFAEFLDKAVGYLKNGVHLLIVDLFPPPARDPHGLPNALLSELGDQTVEVAEDKPLTLSAYQTGTGPAGSGVTAFVEPLAIGDTMKDMPANLDAGQYILVPLETSYQVAWATCPADMRELVETGKLAGE